MSHIVTPGFVDRPRRSDCTAGQMDGEAGWWTTSGNIGLPPLVRVMGMDRQQQQQLWKWGITENNSFQMLKREMCKQAYAILEQQDDIGNWTPLAYGSLRVTDAEKRYDAHKLEFLALNWVVSEQFSKYLTSSKFTVFTDNNPLTYILKNTHLDAIAQRWVAALADYDFEIIYKPGIENGVADALSRRHDEERDDRNKWIELATRATKNFKRDDDDCEAVMKIQKQMNIDWNEEQKHDDDIRMTMYLIKGSDEKETSNKFTAYQRKMRRILPKFCMHNELLYYREDVEDVLVVPRRLQRQIATEYHEN